MTRGIILMCWKKRGYGFAAWNLAFSIKHFSSNIPICLFADEESIRQVRDRSVFDWIQTIDDDDVSNPAELKTRMYHNLPFEHNLFLDVDALCLQDVNQIFDRCIQRGGNYYVYVYDWYNAKSEDNMPMMFWARRSTIWDHFGFTDETRMPATQSSIQYMRKSDEVDRLGKQVRANLQNPIPLNELTERWGGTQPDELYLNCALAQLGYTEDVHIGECIFFGYEYKMPFHEVKAKYEILSLFGGRGHTKHQYLRGYDGTMGTICKEAGRRHEFESKYIISDKHANKSTTTNHRKERAMQQMQMNPQPVKKYPRSKRTVTLITTYHDTGDERRQAEFDTSLRNNIECAAIDRIVLLVEGAVQTPQHEKLGIVRFDKRPTYADALITAEALDSDYKILTNTDIYFDEGLNVIHRFDFDKRAICLSRYDMRGNKAVLFNYEHSQDSWIWQGKLGITDFDKFDFYFGRPGCDNRFAFLLTELGFRVVNPSVDLRSYHLHQINIRTYTEANRVPPPYCAVKPESITKYLKKRLLIRQNGKVGDVLIVLPIARYYAASYDVYWQIDERYHSLFDYVDYVTPVRTVSEPFTRVIDLNFGLEQNGRVHAAWIRERQRVDSFVSYKYELAEVPIDERFRLNYRRNIDREERLAAQLELPDRFAVVHTRTDYGTPPVVETDLPVIEFKPVDDYTIFDWRIVLERADEIHCIDSSLCNFVELIPTKAKLFYYITDRVPEQYDRTLLRKNWTTINLLEHEPIDSA